jgi:hypothetical protein
MAMVSSFMSSRHHGRSKAGSPTSGCCPRSAKQQAHFSACRHAFDMSTRLQRVMPNSLPDGGAVTTPAGSGDHRPRRPPPEPLNALVARRVGAPHWEQLVAPGAHLQRQDSDTCIFWLSRLPDSGMILVGSHEDRAPDAESCARPTRLVELPALLDHPDDPTGPVWSGPDRRGIQREQARSVWSGPDRRRAPGYGSDGWFLYSLPAHVPGV